jgi:hypothetical protein
MNQLVPMNELQIMAEAIASSGLFGAKKPAEALALMLVAQAEGRHPATVARDYDIIQGKPAKKAEAMLRDFIESGGKVEWHALDDTIADATFSHPSGGTARISWDIARAGQAGLGGKDMWKKWPRQMLRSRTVSEGVRTVCPSATSGMYVPEEVRDFAPEKNMGDAVIVQPKAATKRVPIAPPADEVAPVTIPEAMALYGFTEETAAELFGKPVAEVKNVPKAIAHMKLNRVTEAA